MIFYGHHHQTTDLVGKRRYLNPGSAGCQDRPEMQLLSVEDVNEVLVIKKHMVVYIDKGLMEAFDERNVPAREFIRKVFITR